MKKTIEEQQAELLRLRQADPEPTPQNLRNTLMMLINDAESRQMVGSKYASELRKLLPEEEDADPVGEIVFAYFKGAFRMVRVISCSDPNLIGTVWACTEPLSGTRRARFPAGDQFCYLVE